MQRLSRLPVWDALAAQPLFRPRLQLSTYMVLTYARIPGVIDPAARGRSQHDGEQLLDIYKQLGLKLTVADNGVESGIYSVWERLSSGRLKIFGNMQNLLAEMRIYRRNEKGAVVKSAIMRSTRCATWSCPA